MPTIPDLGGAPSRETAFPHDTIPAPPPAEHDDD